MKADFWKTMPQWGFPVGDIPMTIYAAIQGKVRMLADTMCVYRWFADGSWTARNDGNPSVRAKTCEKMIQGMENLNRDTDYRYNDLFQKKIQVYKYTKALMECDFAAIQSDELIDLYRSRSFIYRMSDVFRCKVPKGYRLIQRIMGKNW